MDKLQDHIKILSTLSLAASDTREDTLSSVIIKAVDISENTIQKELLPNLIVEHFQFKPYKTELDTVVIKLIDEGKLLEQKGILSLSKDQKEFIIKNNQQLNDNDKKRFQNFKAFIIDDLETETEISDIKYLWENFLNYLYNCFYEYGQEALKTLHPHITFENDKDFETIAQKAIIKLKSEKPNLADTFQKAIEEFPNYATEPDLNFLVELAQKSSSFSSLGIAPDLADKGLDVGIIDWTLYLDTNVLYSLLDLHSHPESEVCKALIQLILDNENFIKIKLRYSEYTYKELKNKQQDFKLLDAKMSSPAIKALIKSGKIDPFAEQFYRKLLVNPEETLHPSDIVRLSQSELESEKIKIGRNKKRLEHIGEEYIDTQISDFYKFVDDRNAIKEEFNKNNGIPFYPTSKSESQVRHDIVLREILRDSRNLKDGQELTMNNVKFFGLTLDQMLISFDRSKTKDYHDEDTYPIFFRPSFLLDKLTRILPVQTVNYKKAFVKALTTKGFHKNGKKSKDILKLVNHLKNKGIDNTDVIYNLITEDLFLDKLKENDTNQSFNQDEFISSEINRQLTKTQEELSNTKSELITLNDGKSKIKQENVKLLLSQEETEKLVIQYQNAVKSLSSKVKAVENSTVTVSQSRIDFEGESQKLELSKNNAELKRKLKSEIKAQIDDYKDSEIKKWQNKVWWNLLWVIPILICAGLIIFPTNYNPLKLLSTNLEKPAEIFLGLISLLINFFFIFLVYKRYYDENEKIAKKTNIRIPKDFQKKLDDLK